MFFYECHVNHSFFFLLSEQSIWTEYQDKMIYIHPFWWERKRQQQQKKRIAKKHSAIKRTQYGNKCWKFVSIKFVFAVNVWLQIIPLNVYPIKKMEWIESIRTNHREVGGVKCELTGGIDQTHTHIHLQVEMKIEERYTVCSSQNGFSMVWWWRGWAARKTARMNKISELKRYSNAYFVSFYRMISLLCKMTGYELKMRSTWDASSTAKHPMIKHHGVLALFLLFLPSWSFFCPIVSNLECV